jgi:hypothetical protein
VLIPVKWWRGPLEDSWKRRLAMLPVGILVGLEAFWLEGYPLPMMMPPEARAEAAFDLRESLGSLVPDNHALTAYVSYFGLIFFVMRWWKLADRRRTDRFSLFGVMVAGFWAYVFIFLLPSGERRLFFVPLVMASVIIQVVSPWQRPLPARAKRLRWRYA